ncbi:hypothetical protein FisN_19Lh269 [Fistulifera solaris]|uniref:J domain-containing protein n=1 Tax=Fistulifera solaris TaxID=1519565 RepID=A0A1Z5K7P2_FISSO|nr:hypothetical protein FisN_19Lh269 [Fistulifera solaris]|eukprot:GAX22205.1 hypothetical protein FisN_19Lh269 [Fistulifera solaris]
MEEGDDPYQILGVSHTATAAEIRTAYRRLALQHHPDKQPTVQDKERVTPLFVKISNAYEVLSDPEERARYDHRQQQQQQQTVSSLSDNHHPFAFHDPFQLFEELFPSQLTPGSLLFPSFGGMRSTTMFGMNPMGGLNMGMNNYAMGGMGMGMHSWGGLYGDPFLGGLGGMMSQPSLGTNFLSPTTRMNGDGMSMGTSTMTSFTRSDGTSSVSVATTTRIVNGQRETRTERIIRHPDGTTERIVETPQTEHPRIESPPSDATLSSTEESSSAPKRKNSVKEKNATSNTKPRKRRKTNTPEDGDKDRPIVLE